MTAPWGLVDELAHSHWPSYILSDVPSQIVILIPLLAEHPCLICAMVPVLSWRSLPPFSFTCLLCRRLLPPQRHVRHNVRIIRNTRFVTDCLTLENPWVPQAYRILLFFSCDARGRRDQYSKTYQYDLMASVLRWSLRQCLLQDRAERFTISPDVEDKVRYDEEGSRMSMRKTRRYIHRWKGWVQLIEDYVFPWKLIWTFLHLVAGDDA